MSHKIVLIGSGKLATALGKRFISEGIEIGQVYSRNPEHAQDLSRILGVEGINTLDQITHDAALYLICIKDDAIPSLTQSLRKHLGSNVCIAHTSGVNSPDIIDPYFANRGLFYPLQSFHKDRIPDWSLIPVFIEGEPVILDYLSQLAKHISPYVLKMNDQIRTHLHLASVFANNFSNFNLSIAKQILEKTEVPFHVLKGLMIETIEKAFELDPFDTQTGPARRNDFSTIEKHIRLLVSEYPEYRSLYKKYSQIIMQAYKHEDTWSNSTSATTD